MTTTATPPATPLRAVPPSRLIQRKLRVLRRRHVGVAVLAGLALAVAVTVELLAVAMFIDWWLDLPLGVRLVLLIAQAGVVGYILFRQVLWPLARQPDEDELALMVERAKPELRTQLISAVQLTRPGAIPSGVAVSLVDSLVEQTEARVAPEDFARIVPTDRAKKLGALAVMVTLLGLAGLIYGQAVCFDLLKRAFLSNVPVPRKTRVFVTEGDKVIGRGDDVRLSASAEGIIPNEGKVELRYRARRPQEFPLEQNSENLAHFGRTIENVQDSFTYRVFLNDGVSATHTIQAIPRPTVAAIECVQVYPAYTGLPPARRPLGDLTLLAGSQLQLTITATKDIRQAALRLVGPDRELPLVLRETNPRELAGTIAIPVEGLTGFSVLLLDTEGMESRDSAVYRVEILPDKAPQVRLFRPDRKEELVTRNGAVRLNAGLQDDFGIETVRLHYKLAGPDSSEESSRTLAIPEIQRLVQDARGRGGLDWSMGQFSPSLVEGTLIEYWIEAVDNNNATGPGVGQCERQLLRVVTAEEKKADLFNRASDYLGAIEEVTDDQQKANKNLGTIILENAGPK